MSDSDESSSSTWSDWSESDLEWEEEDEEESEYEDDEEVIAVFQSFARKKDTLNHHQVLQALRSLGHFVTGKEAKTLCEDFDVDGDGRMNVEEFSDLVRLMNEEDEEEEEEEDEEEEEEDEEEEEEEAPVRPPKPPTGSVTKKAEISKALFIGINYPGSSAELSGCVNDVRTMTKILERLNCSFKEKRVLVDDAKFPGRGGAPTRKNIEAGMRWLGAGAKPGDTLFLHYSGHGTQMRAVKDSNEEDGMDEAVCPCDYETAGCIRDDDIYKMCVKGLPTGVRLTAVFDCCHSGSIMDLPYTFRATREACSRAIQTGQATMNSTSRVSASATRQPNVFMISGCRDDQTSADVQAGSQSGGACTNAIAEAFSGKGNRKEISLVHLLNTMRSSLEQGEFSQVPQLSAFQPAAVATKNGFIREL